MILNKKKLREAVVNKKVIIKDEKFNDIEVSNIKFNPNSIDVSLHNIFKTYYPFLQIELEKFTVLLDINSGYHLIKETIFNLFENKIIDENIKNNIITTFFNYSNEKRLEIMYTEKDFYKNPNLLKEVNNKIKEIITNKYSNTITELFEKNIKKTVNKDIENLADYNNNNYIINTVDAYQETVLLDIKNEPIFFEYEVNHDKGLMLFPNILYLGVTKEYIGSNYYVPMYEGRSSTGRAGISSHVTAGFGDIGFIGYWTLEIWVLQPTILYPGMRIGQIYFYKTDIEEKELNNILYKGKYIKQNKPIPIETRLWKDF